MKKCWEVKYFINKENRNGVSVFWSNNPEKWIRDMHKFYPEVDFYEYRELPNSTAT